MAEAKKKENEDIKFDVNELATDDGKELDRAREKRNSPAPEGIRDKLDKTSWPVTEGRKPAVMPADTEADHEYQYKTLEEPNENARDLERTAGPGAAARVLGGRKLAELAETGESGNDFQAPPSAPARVAAEGGGAPRTVAPVLDEEGTTARKSSDTKKK